MPRYIGTGAGDAPTATPSCLGPGAPSWQTDDATARREMPSGADIRVGPYGRLTGSRDFGQAGSWTMSFEPGLFRGAPATCPVALRPPFRALSGCDQAVGLMLPSSAIARTRSGNGSRNTTPTSVPEDVPRKFSLRSPARRRIRSRSRTVS
jgi:hypothetical protein